MPRLASTFYFALVAVPLATLMVVSRWVYRRAAPTIERELPTVWAEFGRAGSLGGSPQNLERLAKLIRGADVAAASESLRAEVALIERGGRLTRWFKAYLVAVTVLYLLPVFV